MQLILYVKQDLEMFNKFLK